MQSEGHWDGSRLRRAMVAYGHGPSECASALRHLDPNLSPNKGSVIGWRDGKHAPRNHNRRVLEKYMAEAPGAQSAGQPDGGSIHSVETALFNELMESVTTERPLEGRQADLVDALIRNLAHGEFNEHYTACREQVSRIIGLGSTI